jgi:hypothetical protein
MTDTTTITPTPNKWVPKPKPAEPSSESLVVTQKAGQPVTAETPPVTTEQTPVTVAQVLENANLLTKPLHSKRALGATAGGLFGVGGLLGPLPQLLSAMSEAHEHLATMQACEVAAFTILFLSLALIVLAVYIVYSKFADYKKMVGTILTTTSVGGE